MHIQRIAFSIASFFPRELEVVVFSVLQVQIRRAERHRAVHVDRHARDALLILQLPEVTHEHLGPPDCERWNHDGPAALHHAIHDLRKQLRRIAIRMFAVTIGRLADQHVRFRRRSRWILQDHLAVPADVSGKYHDGLPAALGDGQLQAGRAENVPRVVRRHVKLRADVEATAPRHGLQLFQNGIDIVRGVESSRLSVPAVFVRLCV